MASRPHSCIHPNADRTVIFLLLLSAALFPGGTSLLHAQQSAIPAGRDPVFRKGPTYSTEGVGSFAMAVGDFNRDGKLDLAVTNECQDFNCFNGSVTTRLGNGNGTFRRAMISSAGNGAAFSMVVGDFNHDGKPDLGVASVCVDLSSMGPLGEVHGLVGNGDGRFENFFSSAGGAPCPYLVAIGDFNLDGNLDLAVTYSCDGFVNCTDGVVGVFLGMGDGNFLDPVFPAYRRPNPRVLRVGDFNNDGKPDLVVGDKVGGGSESLTVLSGNGDGTFQVGVPFAIPTAFSITFIVGDFNGDGKLDLAGASGNNSMALFLGNGDGTFQAVITTNVSSRTFGGSGVFAAADFNCDGKLDLAVSGSGITVLLGNGHGRFHSVSGFDGFGFLAVGDFNVDGKPDLAVDDSSHVTVFLNVFHGFCHKRHRGISSSAELLR